MTDLRQHFTNTLGSAPDNTSVIKESPEENLKQLMQRLQEYSEMHRNHHYGFVLEIQLNGGFN